MLSLGHSFKQALSDTEKITTANDLIFDFRYTYNERVALNGGIIYNLEEESSKLWRIGGSYTRDCWSISASVSADIRPRPTNTAGVNDYTQEYGFFVQLNFIPFASIDTGQLESLTVRQ